MAVLPKIYKKRERFVIRTIKRGRAKIYGFWFEPRNKPIRAGLEHRRVVFGIYWSGAWDGDKWLGWQMEDYVCLWGSEEMYLSSAKDDDFLQARHEWHELAYEDGTARHNWWQVAEKGQVP